MLYNWKNILYRSITVALILYALVYGLYISLPELGSLEQSSRNLFYHVPMWMVVIVMMAISVVQSVRLLRLTDPDYEHNIPILEVDARASEAARVGAMFIVFGLLTGSVWGRVAWKEHEPDSDLSVWWTNDPILICALVSLLIYLAYFLLRSAMSDVEQRAKISAVYNIFAFATLIPLYFIIPKLLPGLHPTADGSDAGGGSFVFTKGLSNQYRAILYPAMLGFILLGYWLYHLRSKLEIIRVQLNEILADKAYYSNK